MKVVSSETHKDNSLRKQPDFTTYMTWCWMPGKSPEEMAIITSTVKAQDYTQISDTFLIPLIESKIDDDGAIFQNDNVSCSRVKSLQAFLQGRNIS